MFRRAIRYIAVALLLVACSAGKVAPGSVGPGPDAGHVLFGTAYDHASFAISGRTTQAPQGQDIVFVAHFASLVPKGQIHVLAVLDGKTIIDEAIGVTNGPWSVYGGTIQGARLFEPGELLMKVVDDGLVPLSSGTLTVTPGPGGSGGSTPSPSPS